MKRLGIKEEVELNEALKKGAKVEVPHKGKRTQGTVVRYVPQRGAASPYYVVYVGEYRSIEVPAHKIKEEVELDEYSDAERMSARQKLKQIKKGGERKSPALIKKLEKIAGPGWDKYDEEVELELDEDVFSDLQKIVKDKQASTVKFKNKEELQVDLFSASALVKVVEALKPANAKKMKDQLNKGESSFLRMVDFAMRAT
jgi:hypothetical protein